MKKFFDIQLFLILILGIPAIINTYLNFNIPFIVYFFLYGITLIILLTINRKKLSIPQIKLNKELITVLVLIVTIFITKFLSVIKFTTPPLHDPATHAYFAKIISDSGIINFYYSPLLHSVIAFINQLTKLPIPKLLIMINSIFLIIIPINTYLLIKKIFNNKIFGYLSFIAIAIAPSPNNLFYTAGKNSFIFGLLITIISSWYLLNFIQSNQKKDLIKLAISLLTLFFCHYPIFVITIIIMSPFILKYFKKFFNIKTIYTSIILIITSFIIIFSWYANKIGPTTSLGINTINKFQIISGTEIINKITIDINNNLNLIINNLNISKEMFLLILFLICYFLPIKNKKTSLLIITLILTWLFLIIIKSFTKNYIIHDTFLIFITPVFYVLASNVLAIIIQKLNNQSAMLSLIIIIFLFKQIEIGGNYRKTEYQLDPVSSYDLEAFKFISKDINNSTFLSANEIQKNENEIVVFATDSALWLPVYTNSQIATPFWDFGSDKSVQIAKITKEIINEKKDDTELIKQLKEMGVEYIYLDKGIFGGGLSKEYFNKVTYKSIFKNNEVEILKI